MSAQQQDLDVTLQPDLSAPERARNSIDYVKDRMSEEVLDDVKLLVNELVTNSVKFGVRGGSNCGWPPRTKPCVSRYVMRAQASLRADPNPL